LDSLLDESDGTFSEEMRETAKRIMSSDTGTDAGGMVKMTEREVELLMSAMQAQLRDEPDPNRIRGEVDGVKRYWHHDATTLGPGTFLVDALSEAVSGGEGGIVGVNE
jgi:hypothetical protein